MPWQHVWIAKLEGVRGQYQVVRGRMALPAAAVEEGERVEEKRVAPSAP